MTPQEWIAEANARWRWPHGEFAQEGATHLAAALKEVARLKAESGRVVVPEMTEADLDAVWDAPNGCHWNIAAKRGYALAASRVHSVPSSRVLKDGEVGWPKAERDAAVELLEATHAAMIELDDDNTCDMSGITKAARKWDALRAQGKETP